MSTSRGARSNKSVTRVATRRAPASPAKERAPSGTRGEPPAARPDPARPRGGVALLAIGDELLQGEIGNANAAYLSDRLSEMGLAVREHAVVSDDAADIARALRRLSAWADALIVTGGLGPTEDDRTVDAACAVLGVAAEAHEPSLLAMKKRFSAHGFELTPNNLRQVRVPAGAEALPNPTGIAPGFRVRLHGADAWFLPGVPREMEAMFAQAIAPALRASHPEAAATVVRTYHVYGMGESHVDHRLAQILNGVPGASLHFRTAHPENHVKLVVRGPDAAENRATLARVEADLRRRIGAGIYGVDDVNFSMAVAAAMKKASASLALAESCTGGLAGAMVTAEPGASEFFRGSIVCYADDVKTGVLGVKPATLEKHGAVSEQVAKEMAEGALRVCGSTLAVAITGIAGADKEGRVAAPAPATPPGEKPVGTVCFAIAGPRTTRTNVKHFSGGRERIRRAAAYYALDMARRYFEKTFEKTT